MKTSIIIPVKDNEGLTEDCIESIKENTKDYEIIIVDNGSERARTFGRVYIRNNENLGFPKAVNQGIKEATGDIIVILNNDTIVTPNWLDHLEAHFKNFDMVGPVSNSISGPQKIEAEEYTGNERLYKFAEKLYKEHKGGDYPWHRLVFFCIAIKRKVIDKIGLLDEQFTPGNFEDDDFCLRAISAGFRLGIAQDVFIHHMGGATHKTLNIDFAKLMETNQAKFKAKWSDEKYQELVNKNYENCDAGEPKTEKTIALVMIVKNEEKGLERAILSCKDFVQEIVIAVDDLSTDKTKEIAYKHASIVKDLHWNDDFAEARNFAQAGVQSDWILFLDGHEYVEKSEGIREKLNSDKDALLCTVEMENGAQFRSTRIYKNGIKFEGKIHELPKMDKIEFYTEFLIKHDRAGGQNPEAAKEREKQRDDQSLRIMGSQLKKNKRNIRASFHLGLYCMGRGKFKEAIKYFNRYLKFSKITNERWFIFYNKAMCNMALNRRFRAIWAANRANEETPGRWEIDKIKGMIYFEDKQYQRAIESFVNSFHINTGDQTYKPGKRDDGGTWNLIGESYFRLNNYFKAHVAFEKAHKDCKDPAFKKVLYDRAKLMLEMAKHQGRK